MGPREMLEAVSAIIEPVYLVGGSVRDALMGRDSADFDFATPLDPDSVEAAIRAAGRHPYLVGKKFGTVGVRVEGHLAEITTFRAESYSEGSRKPSVEFLAELVDDLSRRDFTINAMALSGDELVDPFGGRADLEDGVVRAVGDAEQRFAEDPLRMLRAARFVAQLGFAIDPATAAAMTALAPRILPVARERWMLELDKLLVGRDADEGLCLLARTGLLRYLLPELQLQVGFDPSAGGRDLFAHTLAVVSAVPPDATLRWAALLHDVGKPYARVEVGGAPVYPEHAAIGAVIAERLALQLKWSNKRGADVVRLVAEHMEADSPLRAADDAAREIRE